MNNLDAAATLHLPRALVNQLLQHAQRTPDEEICGLIGALGGEACHYYPIANVSPDRTHRYEMNPAQQIEAMRTMRERGETLLAIVHSHPTAPAIPSDLDRSQANYPDCAHLIVSLHTRGVLDLRGYRLCTGRPAQALQLILD